MSKKINMTAIISEEDYDWMMKFIESESPDDGYDFDAPWKFANLIETAHFKEVEDDE